jgi:radical SAM protein with 4Fe4S-binding SPASM domain
MNWVFSRLVFSLKNLARRLLGFRFSETLPEPESIFIELTNRCNYSCEICPLKDSVIPKQDMDSSLFKKIIDDIAAWNPDRETIALHVFGEPFLHNQIFDFMDYIEEELKKCKIFISSNFSVVDRQIIERFFKPNTYNLNLGVWLDTLSPEVYSKQRGGEYSKVVESLDYFIELKRRYDSVIPELHVGMIVTEYNKNEVDSLVRFWKKKFSGLKGVEIRLRRSHDWSGQVSSNNVFKSSRILRYKNVCLTPFRQLVVFSNGDVGLCCHDVDHKILIGNVRGESLKSIWTSEKANSFREAMKNHELDSFEPCNNCAYYNYSVVENLKEIYYNTLYRIKVRV